jgi:hypothetical protein
MMGERLVGEGIRRATEADTRAAYGFRASGLVAPFGTFWHPVLARARKKGANRGERRRRRGVLAGRMRVPEYTRMHRRVPESTKIEETLMPAKTAPVDLEDEFDRIELIERTEQQTVGGLLVTKGDRAGCRLMVSWRAAKPRGRQTRLQQASGNDGARMVQKLCKNRARRGSRPPKATKGHRNRNPGE